MQAGRESVAVWAIAVTQTLGYACFFYIFAALILYWRSALPWGDGVLASGMTLAVVVSAVIAPFAGRAVDLGRAVWLLAGGAAVGAVSLALLAVAAHPAVYLVAWAGLGAAQAMCLYEVAFALLIRRHGTDARAAITQVTLVAGFASTLAFPAGAALAEAFGWRVAVWVAAGLAAGVILPLNLWAARVIGRKAESLPQSHTPRAGWQQTLRRPGFIPLALVFSLLALDHWMLVAFLRPALDAMGVADGAAVTAAALIGPAQVAGRVALMAAGMRLSGQRAFVVTLAAFGLAPLLLVAGGVSPLFAFGFALLQGAANGILTILRPVLVSERMGAEGYGATAGLMSIPTLGASALAPSLGAGLMGWGGPMLLVGVAGLLALAALGIALAMRRG